MEIDWKALDVAIKMAGSRTIAPYHFATASGETWHRAKAVLQRYARNGVVEELRGSRFRVPMVGPKCCNRWQLPAWAVRRKIAGRP